MHHDRSTPGPPSAGTWWLDGAPARGSRRWRIVFVGNGDEAPDGDPPLVELLRSRWEVEEQLRAPKLLLAWAAATAAWTVERFDF